MRGYGDVLELTPVMDTSAYTAGDVWFDTTEIANAFVVSGGAIEITSIMILDEDDQAAAAVGTGAVRAGVVSFAERDCCESAGQPERSAARQER